MHYLWVITHVFRHIKFIHFFIGTYFSAYFMYTSKDFEFTVILIISIDMIINIISNSIIYSGIYVFIYIFCLIQTFIPIFFSCIHLMNIYDSTIIFIKSINIITNIIIVTIIINSVVSKVILFYVNF